MELLDGQIVEMTPIGSGSTHAEPQPDIAVVKARREGYRTEHPSPDEILLIIEVADTSLQRDRDLKIPLYAQAQIPDVWLVNLPADGIEVYGEPRAWYYAHPRSGSDGGGASLHQRELQDNWQRLCARGQARRTLSDIMRPPLALALLLSAALIGTLRAQNPLLLRPGDALRVQVNEEPSWSGDFEIGQDGTALLPPLGLVSVTGRPFAEVKDELLRAYQRELVNPAVTITPLVRIAILGEVQRPGLLPVDPTLSLADVVAAVGGITPLGDRNKIRLVRDGRAMTARLDPDSPTRTLTLRSGDQVFVGRRSWWAQNGPVLIGALGSVTAAVIASILVR